MTIFNRSAAKKKQNMIASVLQTTLASASLESQRALRESELVHRTRENWYTAPHSCELQLVQKPAGAQRAIESHWSE